MNKPSPKAILKAHLALIGVALIYGASFLIAKNAMDDAVPARAFIQFRVTGAAILFWMLLPWSGPTRIYHLNKGDVFRLVLCAAFGVTTNQLFFFEGLAITTPVNASIMMVSGPIAVLVMSAILLKEQITPSKVLGIALGAIGALWLILSGAQWEINGLFESDVARGNLFVLINATSYAIYLVIVKPLMSKYNALFVIRWVFTFGVFLVLPFGGPQIPSIPWEYWDQGIIISVLYVILGTTFLTYLGNIIALKTLRPATVGAYIYLQPLIASILSLIFADESWSLSMLGGSLCIFGGVYFVSFYDRAIKG